MLKSYFLNPFRAKTTSASALAVTFVTFLAFSGINPRVTLDPEHCRYLQCLTNPGIHYLAILFIVYGIFLGCVGLMKENKKLFALSAILANIVFLFIASKIAIQ